MSGHASVSLTDAALLRATLDQLVADQSLMVEDAVNEVASAYVSGVRDVLTLLGLLHNDHEVLQPADETAGWVLRSLAAHVADQVAVSPWYSASLLETIEMARAEKLPTATPVRTVVAANVLIKTTIEGQPHVLMQYDVEARQFQLIGGKYELDDPDLAYTALREIREELDDPTLVTPADLILVPLDDRFAQVGLSPTYGVLSRYDIAFFHVQAMRFQPKLNALTGWISVSDMEAGQVADGRAVSTLAIEVFGDRVATLSDSFTDLDSPFADQSP